MVKLCVLCNKARAVLKRPKTGQQICQECFFYVFETEIHNTIIDSKLFARNERVAIGASGGKGNKWFYIYQCEKIYFMILIYMCVFFFINV